MIRILSIILLIGTLGSCGQPITPEEKARLESQITDLNQREIQARDNYNSARLDLTRMQNELEETQNQIIQSKTELGILKTGKQPIYILKCHFQEHKMELSMDRISFDFEIPVDERFYKESTIGEELGSGSRMLSFGHSGDIKVVNKRIQ